MGRGEEEKENFSVLCGNFFFFLPFWLSIFLPPLKPSTFRDSLVVLSANTLVTLQRKELRKGTFRGNWSMYQVEEP